MGVRRMIFKTDQEPAIVALRERTIEARGKKVEVVEEEGGMGIDDGIIIMTTLLLLTAVLFMDYTRGKFYGEGMLFAADYEAPEGFTSGMAPSGTDAD